MLEDATRVDGRRQRRVLRVEHQFGGRVRSVRSKAERRAPLIVERIAWDLGAPTGYTTMWLPSSHDVGALGLSRIRVRLSREDSFKPATRRPPLPSPKCLQNHGRIERIQVD